MMQIEEVTPTVGSHRGNPYEGIEYSPLTGMFSASITVGYRKKNVGIYGTLAAAIEGRQQIIKNQESSVELEETQQ